jgi:hypothetical protein
MSTELRARRAVVAWRFVGVSLALAALAFVVVAITGHALRGTTAAGPVVAELTDQRMESVRRIIVRASDNTFTIERGQSGWVMRERGDYPVRADAIEALTKALQGLSYERRMTSDPEKLDRIGLGDPLSGGRGVLLQMEDAQGALVTDLVVGVASESGGTYVRRANQNQAWAVTGDMPDLRAAATWLSLRPLTLDAAQVVRVDIAPAEGRGYGLVRAGSEGASGFVFAPPSTGVQPNATTDLEEVALRVRALAPTDVAPAASVQGPPRARIALSTSTALIVDAEVIPVGEDLWVKLNARATVATPEAQAAAAALNQASAAWAFKLTPAQAQALAPTYESLLPQTQPFTEGPPLALP